MTAYLDRISATELLKTQGFNPLDIECVLDLTGPMLRNGTPIWPADRIERLAARAYWLSGNEVSANIPAAA